MSTNVLLVAIHLVPACKEFQLLLSTDLGTEMHFRIHPGLPHQSAFGLGTESSPHSAGRSCCLEELS